MARQNLTSLGRRPARRELLILRVVRRQRLSPTFVRVTLGGDELTRFTPMGADQWARFFLPVDDGGALAKVPARLTPRSYLRFLTLAKTERPLMRSYTISGFHTAAETGGAAELDLDVVLHRLDDGDLAPAAAWAARCELGTPVGLIDEGIGFAPVAPPRRVLLAGDVTALPAIAGILAGLPAEAVGRASIEVPTPADRRRLARPAGIEVDYILSAESAAPGATLTARVRATPLQADGVFAWVAGEASLVNAVRRHWIAQGVPKGQIAFCGYWRA